MNNCFNLFTVINSIFNTICMSPSPAKVLICALEVSVVLQNGIVELASGTSSESKDSYTSSVSELQLEHYANQCYSTQTTTRKE